MRVFLILSMLLVPLAATAAPHGIANIMLAQASPGSLLPNKGAPRIGSKQATSLVKQKYQNSKILSINLIRSKGPAVYRVKTLSASGVVKYVFVDGTTGDVFE